MKKGSNSEFNYIIKDILSNERVNKMKNYMQHCNISCYDHCLSVSFLCYKMCKKLNLDYISASRAAMLHDFFLYDWRKNKMFTFHAYKHGKIAYNNAIKEFKLNDIEKDMIINHMWPVTIMPPKYKEGYILTIADKICATKEIIDYYGFILKNNHLMRNAYIFAVFIFGNL